MCEELLTEEALHRSVVMDTNHHIKRNQGSAILRAHIEAKAHHICRAACAIYRSHPNGSIRLLQRSSERTERVHWSDAAIGRDEWKALWV
jgi:hypothetical protein